MVFSKRMRLKCKFLIGNTRIKQERKFKFIEWVLTEDGKSDREIRWCIGISKETFQKLSRVQRKR